MKSGFYNPNTENIPHFCDRLIKAYAYKGKDVKANGWSQLVAKELLEEKIISSNEFSPRKNDFGKENIYESVARQLRGHIKKTKKDPPNTIWIRRYCAYFKCSADYLLGYDPLLTPAHGIQRLTGLSLKAIDRIKEYKDGYQAGICMQMLNILLESDNFSDALVYYEQFLNTGYHIPIHMARNGELQISNMNYTDGDSFQQTHAQIALAKNINDLNDYAEFDINRVFLEELAMNQIRDNLKRIKEEYFNKKANQCK